MLACGHTFCCHDCLTGVQRVGGTAALKLKSIGLTQNSQVVDPAVWLKIPIRALESA
jgi:hypothetical protein